MGFRLQSSLSTTDSKVMKFVGFVCSVVAILMLVTGFLLAISQKTSPNLNPDFFHIFITNIQIAVWAILLEFLTFGFYSVVFIVSQFFSLGFLMGGITKSTTFINMISFFWIHGWTEIVGLIITAMVGPVTFLLLWGRVVMKQDCHPFISLEYLLLINFFLIFISALLETFLGPIFVM